MYSCHKHYEMFTKIPFEELRKLEEECPDCIELNRKERERIQKDETIDPGKPWGQHIELTCKNHPDLRWSTKNISHIGARSIFYFGDEPECNCPGSDLIVAPERNS